MKFGRSGNFARAFGGWRHSRMDVPERWRGHPCGEYFSSQLAIEGFWDEPGQLWLIEPAERAQEEPEVEFLQVGRPGFDSIGARIPQSEHQGFWGFSSHG